MAAERFVAFLGCRPLTCQSPDGSNDRHRC